jgi:hypothetical protein
MMFNPLRGMGGHFELTRMVGASAALVYPFPYLYACVAHGTIPEPSAFGTGYALVLGAIGVMIGAKDIGSAKAAATVNPPPAP